MQEPLVGVGLTEVGLVGNPRLIILFVTLQSDCLLEPVRANCVGAAAATGLKRRPRRGESMKLTRSLVM